MKIGEYFIKDWDINKTIHSYERIIHTKNNSYCGVLAYKKYNDKELCFVQVTNLADEYELLTGYEVKHGFSSIEFASEQEAKDHIDNFLDKLSK